ncbi:hypothetical protein HK097_003310, partial [Rhizophlyctis rosea]
MKFAILALSALAVVDAAVYQKPSKGPDYVKDKTISLPIKKDGKVYKTGVVLDNGWYDSKKNIPGISPNKDVKTWVDAGITEIPNGIKFTKPIARVYLVNEARNKYEYLNLNNKQISFEVDLSGVACGFNAAGYTTHLRKGAAIGEAYCDGQNFCNEMDLLESNVGSQAYTPHPCTDTKQMNGTTKCDPWGPADNAFNNHNAQYGPGLHIDSTKPFTVTTQFAGTGISYVSRQWLTQGSK